MHLLDCRQQIRGLSRLLIRGCSEIPPSLEKGCYDFCNNESETFDDKLKPVWENKKEEERKKLRIVCACLSSEITCNFFFKIICIYQERFDLTVARLIPQALS